MSNWNFFSINWKYFSKSFKAVLVKNMSTETCYNQGDVSSSTKWVINEKSELSLRHNCCGKHFLQKKFDSPVINLSTLDLIRSPSWSCWCCTETTRMMTQSLNTWLDWLSFSILVLICCDLFLQCFAF